MKIIFIASYPRSGSTILDVMIRKTESKSLISIGEFFYIFEKGFKNNEFCADGIEFNKHPFWKKVFDEITYSKKIYKEYKILKSPLFFPIIFLIRLINKNLILYMFPNFFYFIKRSFKNIHKYSKKKIIVDSSKDPRQLFILSLLSEWEVEVIHLIRDVRGTSFSWNKNKIYKKDKFFKKKNIFKSSFRWLNDHIWIKIISNIFFKQKYQSIKYESLETIDDFIFFGKKFKINYLKKDSDFNIEIGGNVNKFLNFKGIKIDNEWIKKMRNFDFYVITFLMWPFLKFFGYNLSKNK